MAGVHVRRFLVSLSFMSEEVQHQEETTWLWRKFDPWLESRKHSNTLIILLLLLAMLPIIGVGLATTRTILPSNAFAPEASLEQTGFFANE